MKKVRLFTYTIAFVVFATSGVALADNSKTKSSQTIASENLSTKSVSFPKVKLKTTFKKNIVEDKNNPVICKRSKRENSRIRKSKKCMTKTEWKKEEYHAKRAVNGRL